MGVEVIQRSEVEADASETGRQALHRGETRFISRRTGRFVSTHYAVTHPDNVKPAPQPSAGRNDATVLNEALKALQQISDLDPENSKNGFNEWGQAECFEQAQDISRQCLAAISATAKGDDK